jgi:hypothetical protein
MDIASKTYPNMKRKHQYCDVCGTLIPAPGFFCVLCDPPEAPESDPEKGWNASQTYLRIALLTLIFFVVAIVRLEIDLQKLIIQEVSSEETLKVAEDKDFNLFIKVNVKLANVRDKPNTNTSKVIFKLTQDTLVEILEKKGEWSKIRSKPNLGEQERVGWIGSKLLDSEIK